MERIALAAVLEQRRWSRLDLSPGDIVMSAGDLDCPTGNYIGLYVVVRAGDPDKRATPSQGQLRAVTFELNGLAFAGNVLLGARG